MSVSIKIDIIYYHRKTIYSECLILFLKLVRDDELRSGIGIEFHHFGAEYEYDLSNKEERDVGTANAPLTYDLIVRLCLGHGL